MQRRNYKVFFVLAMSGLMSLCTVGCQNGSTPEGDATPTATATPTSTSTPTPTITIKSNQTITGHPHEIDYYIPSNATAAVVFLHGGGGKKEGFAFSLGLKNENSNSNYDLSSTGQAWLIEKRLVAIFPQGQSVAGLNWTWNNYVMLSGVDDVSFLQVLAAAIKADATLPPMTKVYLAGHSNGGMMANRFWCESPATFDAYAAFAGPPSTHLDSLTGSNPCVPSTVKPYISIIGDHDTVLQSSGNMASTAWTINPVVVTNPAAWADATPMVLNDKLFHNTRVNLKCGGSVNTPVTVGQVTSYADCANSLQLMIIEQATLSGSPSGGDHCLAALSGPCITTLVGVTGFDPKTAAADFFQAF